MAVTSRNAVLAMQRIAGAHGRQLSEPQPAARVAAVGEATRAVCAAAGLDVALVPASRADARGIVAEFPERAASAAGGGRVLVPVGNLASPVLARGIARKGWAVDQVEAYRTVDGPGPDASVVAAVARGAAGGGFDAVLLTSGSVAERFAAACPTVAPTTRIVAIGRTTEAGARAAGLRVDAVATEPTYRGMRAALDAALHAPEEDA
jgi:uroporphyrinogen-III synthase